MYHLIAIVIKSRQNDRINIHRLSGSLSWLPVLLSTRVVAMVDARLKSTEDTFHNKSRLDEVTATLVGTMQQSQDALRSLNRPIGPTLEDAQTMMTAVQVGLLFRSFFRLFPYLGSAHPVFNLHVLRSCASSIFTSFSFVSFSYNITPPQFPSSYLLVSTHFHLPCSHYYIFILSLRMP